MSSSISGLGSNAWMLSPSASGSSRAGKMAEDLFSKLDTAGNGYLTESQLASAFSSLSSSSGSSSASASDVFKALDSNADGKLTKTELTDSLTKLAQQLDSQFGNSRLDQARGNMPPPPPPPGDDQGLTQDEMSQMLGDISSTDSNLASDLKTTLANFSAADTDGDGKVTFKEMMAYKQSTESGSASSTSTTGSSLSSSSTSSTNASNDAAILKQILDLLAAYGFNGSNNASSTLSLTA